ncbi:MAG: ribbon-helix-helix domain-containing protein [Acidobacteriota bacterium]
MTRTQIQLEEEQIQALRRLSAESGKSIADLVRRGVELLLRAERSGGERERTERALRALGKFSSGKTDIGRHHDDYLDEVYGSAKR